MFFRYNRMECQKELVNKMENEFDHMKLENQLCFLLYASSREMTKQYKPLLEKLNVTYPQYLVLLLLWEHETLTVKKMGELLYLDSGTLTPMLKRMEQQGLITRKRSEEDERSVLISLTEDGELLKEKAADIPGTILGLSNQSGEDLKQLKSALYTLLETLHQKIKDTLYEVSSFFFYSATSNVTSIFPEVAFEYGQTPCAFCTSACNSDALTPFPFTCSVTPSL